MVWLHVFDVQGRNILCIDISTYLTRTMAFVVNNFFSNCCVQHIAFRFVSSVFLCGHCCRNRLSERKFCFPRVRVQVYLQTCSTLVQQQDGLESVVLLHTLQ